MSKLWIDHERNGNNLIISEKEETLSKYLKEEKRYVNVEGKSYLGDEGVAGQFEKTFGELIERFEGKDNISDSDARDILRHMYYDSSNRTGHDALFQHCGDTDKMKKANAELFKYAISFCKITWSYSE